MIDQYNSLAEKFIRKGFWLYLFSFLSSPIGYIIKIILSGNLDVDEIGIIYGVMSLMVLLTSFNDFGMAESLNKFVPEYVTNKNYNKVKTILLYAMMAQIVTGFIVFSIFFFGSDFLSIHYFHDQKSSEIIKIFSFFFLGYTFYHVISNFFQAVQNTFSQKIVEFIRMMFVLMFTLTLYFLHKGNMFNYSLSWVFGLYIGIFIGFFVFYKNYYRTYLKDVKFIFSKKLFSGIIKYATIAFLGAQASTILSQIDMQMIIYLLGNTDAGYYTNYLSMIGIPFIIIGPIFAFLFPVFSELIAKNETKKINLIKSIFTKNFLSFSIVFSILFFVFGTVISSILFGDKFTQSGIILQYSVPFLSFNFLLQINFNILAANGRVKERLYIILKAILFNFIGNLIFIYLLGVSGAAVATGLGWLFIWYLSEKSLKEYHINFDFKYLFKNVSIFGIIGIILYFFFVPLFDIINNRIYEFFFLCLVSLLYFSLYVFVNLDDFKYFLKQVKKTKKGDNLGEENIEFI